MIELFQIDAFTDRPFHGNPAAVCLLAAPADAEWMQRVAAEMSLSETAFLHREDGGLRLRWFTPLVEVDLCGHATLASAQALWEAGWLARDQPARFLTRSGVLVAQRQGEAIELDFPALPPTLAPPPPGLADTLGASPVACAETGVGWLVELGSERAVRDLRLDLGRLSDVVSFGLLVTAAADAGASYDFVSRFFAPAVGVPEDPVTGSAHCALAPYWAPRLGRDEMVGFQASARGGSVRVRLAGDRVRLTGRAVTVFRGELLAGA